jgi:hypothetical protein
MSVSINPLTYVTELSHSHPIAIRIASNIQLSYDLEEDEKKEELEESGSRRPSFMEPVPTSPKKVFELVSVLMKRAHSVAFGEEGGDAMYKDYEIERYGQHIGSDFFVTNYGHAVYCPQAKNVEQVKFYKENKNLFKV